MRAPSTTHNSLPPLCLSTKIRSHRQLTDWAPKSTDFTGSRFLGLQTEHRPTTHRHSAEGSLWSIAVVCKLMKTLMAATKPGKEQNKCVTHLQGLQSNCFRMLCPPAIKTQVKELEKRQGLCGISKHMSPRKKNAQQRYGLLHLTK